MAIQETRLQRYVAVIQRANRIAAGTDVDALLDEMLALILSVAQAEAGTLYLYEPEGHQLLFKVVKGSPHSQRLVGRRISAERGVAGSALRSGEPIFVADVASDPRWDRSFGELDDTPLRTMYCLPLMLHGRPVAVIQAFNLPEHTVDDSDEIALIELLASRLVTEVQKARLLEDSLRRERRQAALVEIISSITATLDREELLRRIMAHACELLNVEATSIWLRDIETGELVLHVASGPGSERVEARRVPERQGIIGHVVHSGETITVNDVRADTRFYRSIDDQSGFVTRSILCVPMRAPRIILGGERGDVAGRVIGGAQALNTRDGRPFAEEDVALFATLASQAATVIRLAQLYAETDSLFNRIIDAITGAIDLKDPYTRGHSQRVSDFSVAIAQELAMPPEEIYQLRIASKLHDVGKIRVPDLILKKPGRLDDSEFREMRQHPIYGQEFLEENGLLGLELLRDAWKALAQHHERLDGKGYPHGLSGEQISLAGRIVAVADVFDAITSHRPYRPAMPVERAFAILREAAGSELDPRCVEALIRARAAGRILTQDERGEAPS